MLTVVGGGRRGKPSHDVDVVVTHAHRLVACCQLPAGALIRLQTCGLRADTLPGRRSVDGVLVALADHLRDSGQLARPDEAFFRLNVS